MADDRLLEELLRSPLDDSPDTAPSRWWAVVAGAATVAALAVAVVWLVGDGPESDVTPGPAGAPSPGGSGTPVAEQPVPEAGRFHEMVALGDGEMLMFGGFVPLPAGTVPFEGTWTFDVLDGRWSAATPEVAPSPRYGHAMAFHPPSGKVVLFGGGATTPRPCPRIRFCPGPEDDQLWQFDPGTGAWEDMTPVGTNPEAWPIPRFGARFAYEPVTERLIMFGGVGVFGEGHTPNLWTDTWAYDPVTNRWEDLTDPDEEERPPGRAQYGLVWHPETERVLMFGGDGISGEDDDHLWALDPGSGVWEDLGASEPTVGPKDRWFHLMTIDPVSGRLVVIGGNGSVYRSIAGGTTRSNSDLDEVWTWSPTEGWLLHGPLPVNLVGVAGGGDPATRRVIAYAGWDVWSYDAGVDEWTALWQRLLVEG